MKKILLISAAIFMLAVGIAFAENWHTANQFTVAWDAVTTNTSGQTIDPAEISYKVYIANAITDPDHANPVEVGTTAATEYAVTLGVEGKYHVGVNAVRTVGGEVVAESAISWSNAPEYDFGIQYFEPPSAPGGLRPK